MSAGSVRIEGFVEKGFEKVRDVFLENFEKRGETGGSCAVFIDNKPVVDLWGGWADARRSVPWRENTKALVFSTTKGMSSLAFSTLHSRGLLDYDERISTYWPEFAVNGKENITVRQLLSHEAGLMVVRDLLTLDTFRDKNRLGEILGRQKVQKKALGRKAYHTWTISLYQSEIARRIDPLGRSIGILFHDEVARPIGADFHIGLPEDMAVEELAEIIPFKPWNSLFYPDRGVIPYKLLLNFLDPSGMAVRSFLNPPLAMAPMLVNKRMVRELEIGSATGIGSARALAAIYGEFASGGQRLGLSSHTVAALEDFPVNDNNDREDMVLRENLIFSLGLEKPSSFFQFGTDKRAYGHQGAGGSAAFADPALKLGFGYVMNQMGTNIANDPREKALRDAVYACF